MSDEKGDEPVKLTLYFGYGSNLWRAQMQQRCPDSEFLGIARLKGYKWIIMDRGYANIFPSSDEINNRKHDYTNEVWGMVYSLQPQDEARLDRNEGVPIAYQKENIEVEFWEVKKDESIVVAKRPKPLTTLVYLNRKLTHEHEPKKEYIYRMNMGIRDAIKEGIPEEYIDQVMRKFIPKEK